MADEYNVFICGETTNIESWGKTADRGKKLAGLYVQVAGMIVAGQRDKVDEMLADNSISDHKRNGFLEVVERFAAFRQTLMTVYGIEKPTYGVLMANLFDEELDAVVSAVASGSKLPSLAQHDGDVKKAKKQAKQLKGVLEAFYKGHLPYQICFVISRTLGGLSRATIAFAEPISFAATVETETADRLLEVSTINIEPVWQPTEARLPAKGELVEARLQAIDYDGKTRRSPEQLDKLRSIVLTCMLKTKRMLDEKLVNASRSPIVLEIKAVQTSNQPSVEYSFADSFVKSKTTLEHRHAKFSAIRQALGRHEEPSDAVKTRIVMATKVLDKCEQELETPTRVLHMLERHIGNDFWGENRLPVLVLYQDFHPHAPIWFAVRIAGDDNESALKVELERLDCFIQADEIPEPAPKRTYAEVVSDSG